MAAAPIAQEKLDAYGIDAVCAAILHPKSMRAIAEEIGVSQGSLISWIGSNPERSARVKEARSQTAQMWDDKATQGIEEAADQFELAKAKELAHHYRWRAAKIAPREYGDKVTQEHVNPDGSGLFTGIKVEFVKPDANG